MPLAPSTATPSPATPADPHRRVLSSFRLKVTLILFVGALVIALSMLIVLLVSRIFSQLAPAMRAELEWKARRGAMELAQTADVGIAVADSQVITRAFGEYRESADVVAIVAVDAAGAVLASHGTLPPAPQALFAGPAGVVRGDGQTLVCWAPSSIEGHVLGKVALAVSTARLEAGERLRRNILAVALAGCLAALLVSVFFVNSYLGPLITLTHASLRTAREMEIAKRIQISILPKRTDVEGLDISAVMVPAEDVGGDYYDVIPMPGGAWIGIGDVAGHGLQAGLIMLMVQSVVSSVTQARGDASPKELLHALNRVLFDNIRSRLGSDEHITFTLLRYGADGAMTFAGAHEDILIHRAATGRCERVITPGAWLGALRDIGRATQDTVVRLERGDVMVLYTDGVTEAKNAAGEMFGLDRLCAVIEQHGAATPVEIRTAVMDAVMGWMAVQDDDITVFVSRYGGPATTG